MQTKIFCTWLTLMAVASSSRAQDSAKAVRNQALRQQEVTLGIQVWGYSRVYPLLDGMFQDVAAIQVSPLTLDSNASNGASMDALQQSLQMTSAVIPKAGGNQPNVASAPVAGSPPTFSAGLATKSEPAFPATKQMENQIGLLWERLSRLVGAMTRPDNMGADDLLYLVKFDTGIFPMGRKKQLLDVTYSVGCTGGTPVAVDVFPRIAAVNITNTKYRDTTLGLSSLVSLFTFGLNAAYNREHLRVSQLLGQSAYITGHGIGQNEFGWLFGMSLGDDSISPGLRSTFALLNVPKNCQAPTVVLKSAEWTKLPASTPKFSATILPPPRNMDCVDCVDSIDFTRNEYDPKVAKTAPVMLTIRLKGDMDQQQSVSVNGLVLKRVRDTFGRATTGIGGFGLLESATMDTNTWISAGSGTMILNLDGSIFGEHLPTILLSSPTGVIDVAQGRSARTVVSVSGRRMTCDSPDCKPDLPSLAHKRAATARLGVARWIEPGLLPSERIDKLCITALETGGQVVGVVPPGSPSVQVIADADDSVWGGTPEVAAIFENPARMRLLTCDPPQGSRLICDAPDSDTKSGERRPRLKLQILDLNHGNASAVGPIKGYVSTQPCTEGGTGPDACRRPLIWKTVPPVLDAAARTWNMSLQLVNVDAKAKVSLGPLSAPVECVQAGTPCAANVKVGLADLPQISDVLDAQIADANGANLGGLGSVTNVLANVSPRIEAIDDAKKHWVGQNLVFNTIRVGPNGPTYPISCPTSTECTFSGEYGASDSGYLYFLDQSRPFPFLQSNAAGSTMAISLLPGSAAKASAAPRAAGEGPASALVPGARKAPAIRVFQ